MEQHDGQFVLIYEVNGFQFVKLSASQISQYLNYEIENLSCLGRQKRFLLWQGQPILRTQQNRIKAQPQAGLIRRGGATQS